MKSKKGKIVVLCLIVGVALASFLGGVTFLRASNRNEGSSVDNKERKVTATSLEAKSYKQIYKQLLMAEIRDYLQYRYFESTDGVDSDSYKAEVPADSKSNTGSEETSSNYGETNVQVQGIDEGDILKNDGKYLYCYENNTVCIVEAKQADMSVCSRIKGYENLRELYVSGDKLILVSQKGSYAIICEDVSMENGDSFVVDRQEEEPEVVIDVYDITDRRNPSLVSSNKQDGELQSSRISDGYLYVIANKNMYTTDMREEDPSTYVPKVNDKAMKYSDVLIPDTSISRGYLIITGLQIEQPSKFVDQKAIFSNGYNCYVSTSNIFIAENLYEKNMTKTLLTKIGYKDGTLKVRKQGKINGYLNNNFSMDEYKGYLRVVTTVSSYGDDRSQMYNNLYVLNNELKTVGSIEKMAKDERIYSARFMGDTGYFVTFRQVDPLFSVDLSNPQKPKVMDALKIPGFSSYLHFYGDNLLLGIGMDADEETGISKGLKLSMFDISNPYDVKEIHKTSLGENVYSEVLSNYKAILVNDKTNIIGFPYEDCSYNLNRLSYAVYSYNEEMGFMEEFSTYEETWSNVNFRGTYINDVFYLLHLPQMEQNGDEKGYIAAYSRKDYKLLKKINL